MSKLPLATLLWLATSWQAISADDETELYVDPRIPPEVANSCLFIGPLSADKALQMQRNLRINGVGAELLHSMREQLVVQNELVYRVEIASFEPTSVLGLIATVGIDSDPYIIQPATNEIAGIIGVSNYSSLELANKLRLELRDMGLNARIQEVQVPIAGNEISQSVEKIYLRLDPNNHIRFYNRIDADLFYRLYDTQDHVRISDRMRFFASELCELI